MQRPERVPSTDRACSRANGLHALTADVHLCFLFPAASHFPSQTVTPPPLSTAAELAFTQLTVPHIYKTFLFQTVFCYNVSASPLNPTLFPQRLANSKAHTSRFISANLPCNKFKNRLVNIMPFESTRVCLQPIRGVEGSDYINASCIDGYR